MNVHFMSEKDNWETPQDLYDMHNEVYKFTTDVAASIANAKCPNFYTVEDDGLSKDWTGSNWMNPPYGRTIGKWVEKASIETSKHNSIVVALLPARTDTKWFHQFIYNKQQVQFLKGRLKFSGHKNSAPFPSMIVIFKKQ